MIYGVSLTWNPLMKARADDPPAPSPGAPPASPAEPSADGAREAPPPIVSDTGSSGGGLLADLAADRSVYSAWPDAQALPFDTHAVPASEDHLSRLNSRLDALEERKRELETEVQTARSENVELRQAAASIRGALAEDNPIPTSLLPFLGSLGLLGLMAGLPFAPILGLLGISVGISEAYRQRAETIAAELEVKSDDKVADADEKQAELEKVHAEIRSVTGSIEQEKARIEREAQPSREREIGSRAIVRDAGWKASVADLGKLESSLGGVDATQSAVRGVLQGD